MPRLLPLFRSRGPHIELELRESTNVELLSLVEAERLDVGLVRFPTPSASALQLQIIEHDVFQAVLPKAHPLAARREMTLKLLAQEPLIDYGSTKVPGQRWTALRRQGALPRATHRVRRSRSACRPDTAAARACLGPGSP
jgi:DNA-binding transcriptional LysR family regulator